MSDMLYAIMGQLSKMLIDRHIFYEGVLLQRP